MRLSLMPSAYAPAVGGVEELTRQLASSLVAHGHEVEVWTACYPPGSPRSDVRDGIRVRRFDFYLPGARLRQFLGAFFAGSRTLICLLRAYREFRPQVLHVQCFSGNGAYATLLSILTGVPMVVTLQGETFMDDHDIYSRSTTLRSALRIGLRRAAAVTGCSQLVLRDARRFGLKKGVVVPNGAERLEDLQPDPLNLPFERFVFAVGRVVPNKGFDLLIDAFQLIADITPVGLVIGGDGTARRALLETVRTQGLERKVLLPGQLSRQQLAWALQNASAFVMPSRIEPFGIVALEAFRSGTPAVLSSRGGIGEFVRDGLHALMADPLNRQELAAAILRVLHDKPLQERLSAAAKSRAASFAWDTITPQYEAIYRRMTSRHLESGSTCQV